MLSHRRGVSRTAGMVVVAVLACLVLGLIILQLTKKDAGPGVTAVPMTGPEARRSSKDAGSTGAAGAKGAKAPAGQDRDLEIQVIDAGTKQPLAGAELSINMQGMPGRKDRTENQGRAWVMLPAEDPKYLGISAKVAGYVTKRIDWRGEAIPATHVLTLERGTSIGGIVKDEEGNAIRGANVNVLFPGDASAGGRGMYNSEGPFTTDDQGRWRCDIVPADLTNLSVRLAHPDFISDESYGTTPRPADGELRAMTAVMVMKRGLVLRGVVMDEAGNPIANASVLQGADRFGSNNPKVRSGPDGQFVFKNARPGATVLTVTAKTFAPDSRSVTVAKDVPPVEFKLAKGNTVRLKVVDVNGKPLAGAWIAADTWRGNRSLDWRVNSKADGTFVWTDAPPDQVLIHLGKQGYQSERNFHISPSEKEWVITLRPPQRIHGSVVDAETGSAIQTFKVISGIKWDNPGQPVYWDRMNDTKMGRDGKYELEFGEPQGGGRLVRIEAAGYLPAISPAYKPDESDVTFDAKLTKGSGPTGTVLLADGSPAAGVDVVLVTPSAGASIRNGQLDARSNGNAPQVKTGADGKFEFVPQVDPFMIIAAGEGGYGEVTQERFKASPQIKLQPWGKVSGKLLIGSKPGANEQVVLNYNRPYEEKAPRFWAHYDTRTDKDGNFTIDRVMPGEVQVSRQVMTRTSTRYQTSTYTHTDRAVVKSGETATVQLGGVGRPVIGKITRPKDAASKGWTFNGGMNTKQPEPPLPKDFDQLSEEKQREWWMEYQKSEAFKEQQKNSRHYSFAIAEDGTFRIEDVLPGLYQIYISAMERNIDQVAMAQKEATVGEIPGGRSDEPLDLGAVELKEIKRLKVGDDLTGFTTASADEKQPFKFDDHKGKLVLMHFWAANHKQSTDDMPALKEIYEAHGKSDRFVMIGFHFERGGGKAYIEKEGIKWIQVQLGNNSMIYQELGLRSFPAYLLIGADGKLMAKDVKAGQLKDLVKAALAK